MSTVDELMERLKKENITIRSIFPGSDPNATPDQVAAAIMASLDELAAGNYTVIYDSEDESTWDAP